MLTVDEALQAVLNRSRPLPAARRPLEESCGLLLAEDVVSDLDLPPFDKATVDGYAVRTADLPAPASIGEEVLAGRTPTRALAPGEAALIMTGAPLPDGADAVVMIEETTREGNAVYLQTIVVSGQNRLLRGRELGQSEVVLRRGDRLNPIRLGLLASVGCVEPTVTPRPTVTVLPTGDELVDPTSFPGPGQIRNSNAPMLAAFAREAGAEAHLLPTAPDEPERLRALLKEGLASDVLVITGGVSAGTKDLVPGVLASLSVEQVFHKVRLKPGKPLLFGIGPTRGDRPGTLVFGLPGNPVSGAVGFLLFVKPALERLSGKEVASIRYRSGRLAETFRQRGDRQTFHPATIDPEGGVRPLPWAGSADLKAVSRADGFAVFPSGDREWPAGSAVDFLPL